MWSNLKKFLSISHNLQVITMSSNFPKNQMLQLSINTSLDQRNWWMFSKIHTSSHTEQLCILCELISFIQKAFIIFPQQYQIIARFIKCFIGPMNKSQPSWQMAFISQYVVIIRHFAPPASDFIMSSNFSKNQMLTLSINTNLDHKNW